MKVPAPEIISRLEKEKNIWLATMRPDGRPHLVPVWFVWQKSEFFICVSSTSVKYKNIVQNGAVSLALEDGSTPVICEGGAVVVERPWPGEINQEYKRKYDWEINTNTEYDALLRILPQKWLNW